MLEKRIVSQLQRRIWQIEAVNESVGTGHCMSCEPDDRCSLCADWSECRELVATLDGGNALDDELAGLHSSAVSAERVEPLFATTAQTLVLLTAEIRELRKIKESQL
jgi:hypothetical protein